MQGLATIRVIDFSSWIAGPYTSKLFADAGADVIKVEGARGDPLRRWSSSQGGPIEGDQDGAFFQYLNCSKRSVQGTPEDTDVQTLIAGADLLIEDFPTGSEALGQLNGNAQRQCHPQLVILSISPFGRQGPYAERPATEFTIQAEAGSIAARGLPTQQPFMAGGRITDFIGGTYAAVAALAALRKARATGQGEHIDFSLAEVMNIATTSQPQHQSPSSTNTGLDFDPNQLREKYRREREKRLRSDGNAQYIPIAGDFAHLADDPFVEPGFTRPAIEDEVDVVLIGGGFGGLLTGARLRQLGVDNLRIIEKGADFGGTWYWNRYPGVACDIESYIYMPLLEELGYLPREKYSRGTEIFDHCKAIARHYRLYDKACLRTTVTALRWDDAQGRWLISTNHGDTIKARFVSLANGFLQQPKLPGIPGIDTFTGKVFHTCRWDYGYTGGDANGGLSKLADKRVGIVGTGATAVQCVPHLGASARQLCVFQRTPSSIDARNNRPTDPSWAAQLKPGWQQQRMNNFQILTAGGYQEQDLVDDGWTDISKNLVAMISTAAHPPARLPQLLPDEHCAVRLYREFSTYDQ